MLVNRYCFIVQEENYEAGFCRLIPFEALEAFTVHVLMAFASTMYCAAAAPLGLLATMNGVISSIHYSFGRAFNYIYIQPIFMTEIIY